MRRAAWRTGVLRSTTRETRLSWLSSRDVWDASKAGPEWRFGLWNDREAEWCRAAYDWGRHAGLIGYSSGASTIGS
jgi:hypothetical protein